MPDSDFLVFDFDELESADLNVDALYQGGTAGNAGDDPISRLTGTGNMGGFRYVGSLENRVRLCVLYSTMTDTDWPDVLDMESGRFIYYGDNKNPGHELHETKKKGNEILKTAFDAAHVGNREIIPPFFIFTKAAEGRDVRFRGLAVPGSPGLSMNEDLVAIWKMKKGMRFQNYKAVFTILDEAVIPRDWILDIHRGDPQSINAPDSWLDWIRTGMVQPLIAPRAEQHRTKFEQLPRTKAEQEMIREIIGYFHDHPRGAYAFEECAARLAVMMDGNIRSYDLTRPWRDGGRDAIGKYRIGHHETSIGVDFALEAKCNDLGNGCGVRATSRLISRLRYRQFGIFVTTSYVSKQAYKEIVEDRHPVIIVAGSDICRILVEAGTKNPLQVREWLEEKFPYDRAGFTQP